MKKVSGRSYAHAFVKHRDFLRAYLRKRGTRPEDIEDLLQETFIRCCEILKKEPDGEHRKLLVTVIRNLHIDQFRRSRKFSCSSHETFLDNIAEDCEGRRAFFQRAILEKMLEDIQERPESRFFKMHYQGGYKIHEIARLTDTAKGTVASQIFRFRNRMQSSICQQLDTVDEFMA